ncbi:glutathione-dependent formaldehyde-activating enzyme [Fusarium beomiforme]|uniref:Glutathione-dependent formaldehyde-activating enzyme n=1 Tax=Fusarium beomiforme TaxID=44412 RepID=A0A9P5DNF5_9HYPO|nr:glutathione-dependent formaldehyde-activating enzyme [Fusarium beomiforme]
MAEEQAPNITYRGSCHCGAFVFEIGIPEIKSVIVCNCSICTKKGYLLLFPGGLDDLKIVKGSIEDLTNYTFSKGKLHHKFCPQCGTAIMATMPNGLPSLNFGLNVRSIQGLDTWSLARQPIDGASLGDKYEAPSYSGAQPHEQIDGGNVYNGSCHCGAVQVALASKLIDCTFSDTIAECNCSICDRNAYIWVWPRREHVVLHSDSNDIGRYFFKDSTLLAKTFCKKCGTQLTNEPVLQSDEAIAAMSDSDRKLYEMISPLHPVNLRVLEGVDLNEIAGKVQKLPGAHRPPKYVNP